MQYIKRKVPRLTVAVLAALPAASNPLYGADEARPNVLLIVTDDMGYSDAGVFGCKDIKTPNIDRLAASGTRFTDAYVTAPICVPSRMGFLSGRYQERWGVFGNADGCTQDGMKVMAAQTCIAELFQQEGYATAIFGKWHLSSHIAQTMKTMPETLPEQNGFDQVTVIEGGMSKYWAGVPLYDGHKQIVPAKEYLTDEFGSLSVDFIRKNKKKPFFVCLTFNAVHAPLNSLPEDEAKYADEIPVIDRRTYAGMMTALDRNVGRVLDALSAAGVEENTIVVFLSDNGGPAHDAAAHSRNMADNGPLRGHKFDVLEGGIRTPLIMKWPGRIPAGKTFAGISSSMDLAATFMSAARLSAPAELPLDGVDLLPYLQGKESGDPHAALFWECNWYEKPDCAARRGRWKIVQLRTGPAGPLADQWELYDLATDIGEARDVAAQHPEIVKELDGAFRAWRGQMPAPWTEAKAPAKPKANAKHK